MSDEISSTNHQSGQAQGEVDALRDLLPAYSIGATDADETAFVERLLPQYPELAAELASYHGLSQAMLYSAPDVLPPAALGERLIAAVSAPASAPTAPVVVPPALRVVEKPSVVQPERANPLLRLSALAAMVAVVLLVASNLYWIGRVDSLSQRERDLTALMHQQSTVLTSIGETVTRHVELASTATNNAPGHAMVVWSPTASLGLLSVSGLPALPADQDYQFWLIADGQPISAGIFDVTPDGSGFLIFEPATPLESFDQLGVTAEPAGGSDQPTMTPIIAGSV